MKVLIVDDEKHLRLGLKTMIAWESLGFDTVILAEDGLEGWEQFTEHSPALLLTDMYMPSMNGVELIKKIRQSGYDTPIIILSGYDDFEYAQEAISLNVQRYILKPCGSEEIEAQIGNVLREQKQQREQSKLLKEINQKFEQNLPILREQFLYQMISMGIKKNEISRSTLEFYQLSPELLEGGCMMSIKIYRPENQRTLPEKDWQLLKFAASNITEEIIAKSVKGHVMRFIDNRLPIMMYGNSPAQLLQLAITTGQSIIDSLNSYLRLDVNIGIGQVYPDATKYSLSFNESTEILEYCELEGFNLILHSENIRPNPKIWPRYLADTVRELSEALVLADQSKVEKTWNKFIDEYFGHKNIPLNYMQTMCTSILSNIILYIIESDPNIIDPDQIFPLLSEIQNNRTYDSLMSWMIRCLDQFCKTFAEHYSGEKHISYSEHVKNIVRNRYSEKLSFAQIAHELKISREYLSNLFKKDTGISFIDYLTHYRINKAKELLLKNRYMVYEVSEMVGYQDPGYFSRTFKKMVGVTPLEYLVKRE